MPIRRGCLFWFCAIFFFPLGLLLLLVPTYAQEAKLRAKYDAKYRAKYRGKYPSGGSAPGIVVGLLFLAFVVGVLPLLVFGSHANALAWLGLRSSQEQQPDSEKPETTKTEELSEREKAILRKSISEREPEDEPGLGRPQEAQPVTPAEPERESDVRQEEPPEPLKPKQVLKGHNVVAAENIGGTMTISVILKGDYTRDEILELSRNLKKSYASGERAVEVGFYESSEAIGANKPVGWYRCKGIEEKLNWGGK